MSLLDTITRTMLVKPHKAGYPFIAGGAVLTILFLLIWEPLGLLFLILTLFTLYFFRDPVRAVPQQDGLVIAPADGRIISITADKTLPDELGSDMNSDDTFTKISIFLSVLDVHVNRVPANGTIIDTYYYEGAFFNAELDKASEENERAHALLKTEKGQYVGFSQIAGLVARRIVTDLEKDKEVEAGQRFGIIRFGSRADIYIPSKIAPLVCVGQRTIGGETILANLNAKNKAYTAKLI